MDDEINKNYVGNDSEVMDKEKRTEYIRAKGIYIQRTKNGR